MRVRRITGAQARAWLPKWKNDFNKGDRGRVYIVAGSRGMAGAAILTTTAAIRSGAGLVKLATVRSQQTAVVKRGPVEATTQALPEDSSGQISTAARGVIQKTLKTFHPDVVAIGPGLGQSAGTRAVVRYLFENCRVPLVVDADGLNALAIRTTIQKRRAPTVITPHAGELARLLKISVAAVQRQRVAMAVRAARQYGAVCVLKGAGTIVTDGTTIWKNTTGNPGLASGGTGDVLTGLVASCWAQSGDFTSRGAMRAAALAVYFHGATGDFAAKDLTARSMSASQMISFFPKAFKMIESISR